MIKKGYIKGHILQYFFILLSFAMVIVAISTDIEFLYKLLMIALSITVYFFWSLWHHWENHELTPEIVLEYLLLSLILLWLLLNVAS